MHWNFTKKGVYKRVDDPACQCARPGRTAAAARRRSDEFDRVEYNVRREVWVVRAAATRNIDFDSVLAFREGSLWDDEVIYRWR